MQKFSKPLLFSACLVPLAVLVYDILTDNLSANPIEDITHFTGDWTIYLLLITLSLTPIRVLSGINSLIRYRRMLGLFTFFYACLHFLTYIVLDQFFYLEAILDDIMERPYITVGFAAFVLLVPLAVTSTNRMVARLGVKRWRRLHTLVYVIAALGLLHFYWQAKADTRLPVLLMVIFAVLMALRLPLFRGLRKAVRTRATGPGME